MRTIQKGLFRNSRAKRYQSFNLVMLKSSLDLDSPAQIFSRISLGARELRKSHKRRGGIFPLVGTEASAALLVLLTSPLRDKHASKKSDLSCSRSLRLVGLRSGVNPFYRTRRKVNFR